MTEGKASQVVRVDSPTRPAKVAVTFKRMRWKATVTTSALGIVRADTAEVSRSDMPQFVHGCVTATYTLATISNIANIEIYRRCQDTLRNMINKYC